MKFMIAFCARIRMQAVFRIVVAAAILGGLGTITAAAQGIQLEIPFVKPGGVMPKRHTAAGKAISPPLAWTQAPDSTAEYALVFEDLDDSNVHWLLYRIPGRVTAIPERIPGDEVLTEPSKLSGTIQGVTSFSKGGAGYAPPVPGHKCRFTLYALDARLGLLPGLDKASLLTLIQGHIAGKGEFVVTIRK